MNQIESLNTLQGRKLLNDIFYQLRYEKRVNGIFTLWICLKICIFEKDISKFVKSDYNVLHSLGLLNGLALWMEEIVNRHYFSVINSFVYLGAAIILILIGLRRFTDIVSIELVIAGIIFEGLMLTLIFIVMFFTPRSDIYEEEEEVNEKEEVNQLILEVGEITTEFATSIEKLDNINSNLNSIVNNQSVILEKLTNSITLLENINKPNDEFLNKISITNNRFDELNNNIQKLIESTELIKKKELRFTIKSEIEKMLIEKVEKEKSAK